jgi:hypothetical protein
MLRLVTEGLLREFEFQSDASDGDSNESNCCIFQVLAQKTEYKNESCVFQKDR